jgi:sialate O-acetylesterase
MHGITLTKHPADWEIVQQKNGFAEVVLEGCFQVHPAAMAVGVKKVRPLVRILREDDNTCVIPWTEMPHTVQEDFSGNFSASLSVPQGGLYRLETSLETESTVPEVTWLYRGDCILHFGVGNLFLIAGQSNSAGHAWDYAIDPPVPGVHLFRNRNRWDMACHPMNESTDAGSLPNEEMGIPGICPYLSFGKRFMELSHCPVGFVQTALGGSSMKQWLPSSGDLYRNLMDKIQLTKGKYAGVLWYQGCSDTTPEDAPLYEERFALLVKELRKELGYEIPFFTFQLNRQVNGLNDECWGMVREAQRKAALSLPAVYVLSTTNTPISDGIHNSAHGNVLLGEKLSKLCGHVLCGGEPFDSPTLKKIELETPTCLKLTFDHVALNFVVYSNLGKDCGFTLTDAKGELPIQRLCHTRQDGNCIRLLLERTPEKDARLSFCWQADPVKLPPVDEVTYLPPLSFYQISIFS